MNLGNSDIMLGTSWSLLQVCFKSHFAPSTLVKMIYAFLWDEESIIPPFIFDPEANEIGAELIPRVNSFANRFNDFTYYEQNFQVGFVNHPT